jgi:hypothetical protein
MSSLTFGVIMREGQENSGVVRPKHLSFLMRQCYLKHLRERFSMNSVFIGIVVEKSY